MDSERNSRTDSAEHALLDVLKFISPGNSAAGSLKKLLALHGSPGAIMDADSRVLEQEGLDEERALLISLVPGLIRHMDHTRWGNHPLITTFSEAEAYMRFKYTGEIVENYHLLALDSSGRLIECVHLHKGNENSVPFYLKKVMSAIISTRAEAIVLCHNHPNGAAIPSIADVECTHKLMRAVARIGAPLIDHLIMINSNALSIRGFGYIKESEWMAQDPDCYLLNNWLTGWDIDASAALLEGAGR